MIPGFGALSMYTVSTGWLVKNDRHDASPANGARTISVNYGQPSATVDDRRRITLDFRLLTILWWFNE